MRCRVSPTATLGAGLVLVAGCVDVPHYSLGGIVFTPCGDASDIACEPFGAPALVSELVTPDGAEKPTLTADMLELYFLSERDGGSAQPEVWKAMRTNSTDPWSQPLPVTAVNSASHEKSPAVSGDGTTLWVASDRPGGLGGLDIWASTRANAAADWSAPVDVTELNTPGDEIPRPPGLHELEMMLSYRSGPNGLYQIYAASRAVAAPAAVWSTPAAVASLDTANLDDDGYLMDDGTTMYFSSDRIDGTQDLFVTERPDPSSPFATPLPMGTLNSTHNDRDPWISPDQHEIWFTSDRTGTLQIYHASR